MNLALVGTGRMGRAVAELARARGHDVVAEIDGRENAGGRALTAGRLAGAEVAVEFTRPDAVVANLERLLALGLPVVTGTTGWIDELPRIEALVRKRNGALLHGPNFSVGIQVLLRAALDLARRLAVHDGFDATILERHHRAKRDAPSGTAAALQLALRTADPAREFPITSVRAGHDPGVHEVSWDAAHETILLRHAVRNRAVFAAGAVRAAEWLPARRGVFTFAEMLFGADS